MEFANSYRDFAIVGVNPASKNTSGEVYVICPKCESTRKKKGDKKLAVNVDKGTWFCQHCGHTGGLTPKDWLKNKREVPDVPMGQLKDLPEKVKNYWNKRGISDHTLAAREVRGSFQTVRRRHHRANKPDSGPQFHEVECTAFLYREKGHLMSIKYRDNQKNFKIEKGKDGRLVPWGLDWIINEKECIITEGEPDALSYHEVGKINVVSVPNGTTISEEERKQFEKTGKLIVENVLSLNYFDHTYQYFENKKVIYIATDDDAAGIKLRNEIGRRFGYEKCKIVKFGSYTYKNENGITTKCKDPNEVLIHCGKEALLDSLQNAEDFPIDDVMTINDVYEQILDQYHNGLLKGKPTGFKDLEGHFSWRFGHLVGINGYGNMGKSYFIFSLCILSSIMYGWKWGMYLRENYPVADAFITFIEIYLGNTIDKDRKGRATLEEVEEAKKWISKHFEFVSNEPGYTPEQLRSICRRMILQRGIVGFVSDPWNALTHEYKTSEHAYLKNELSAEQRFAINTNIIKVILAHPNTPKDDREDPKAPSIYRMEGGGIWNAKLYDAMTLHTVEYLDANEKKKFKTEIHVQKIKYKKLTGMTTSKFDPVILRFNGRSGRFLNGDWSDPFETAKYGTGKVQTEEDPELQF